MGRALAVLAACALLAGCGGTALLRPSSAGSAHATRSASTNRPAGPSPTAYLAALGSEQQQLAAAERRLPRRARTPAALARAILLLRGAIDRLGTGLRALRPPAPVAALHARLTATLSGYSDALSRAARDARHRSGEPRAAAVLLAATASASRTFSQTIAAIDRRLSG